MDAAAKVKQVEETLTCGEDSWSDHEGNKKPRVLDVDSRALLLIMNEFVSLQMNDRIIF